jgi:tRNA A-37 threonylcarbamoyl transferase component Bud32
MNPSPSMLDPQKTAAMLSAVLRATAGAETRLVSWTAHPLSKRGKRRAVRYDVAAGGVDGAPARSYQWAGKFYERAAAARRVTTILQQLARADCARRGGLVIPSVVAYYPPCRLLLLTYEMGGSVIAALAQNAAWAVTVIGRGIAALHAAPAPRQTLDGGVAVLEDLRRRIADLCVRFPGQAATLKRALRQLERQTPAGSAAPSFIHGDLGPAQLLWQNGRLVVLDFDKASRGDRALDLGNLFTQLRRLALRKPRKLPDFVSLRRGILEVYQRHSPSDPSLTRRIAWYERVTLLRKIDFLVSDTTRPKPRAVGRERHAEAIRLLWELPGLLRSD